MGVTIDEFEILEHFSISFITWWFSPIRAAHQPHQQRPQLFCFENPLAPTRTTSPASRSLLRERGVDDTQFH